MDETAAKAPSPTVAEVFEAFLADQRARLKPRTLQRYEEVIWLLGDCLDSYGHLGLEDAELRLLKSAGEDHAFVKLFGPEKIADNLDEFLGYFMIRKVMASKELLGAAGTVTKKLATWLGEHGFLDADAVDIAVEQGSEAARDLPAAERLAGLLYDLSLKASIDTDDLSDEDHVEDLLMIERVEPGKLWFEGDIGPVGVPPAVSAAARVGWSVNLVLGRARSKWQIIEVGGVYP